MKRGVPKFVPSGGPPGQAGGALVEPSSSGLDFQLPEGAMIDMSAYPIQIGAPWSYNCTTARRQKVVVNCDEASFATSNTATFTLQANATPGYVYDPYNTYVVLPATFDVLVTEDNGMQPVCGLDWLFKNVTLTINNEEVNDSRVGLYPWTAWVRRCLCDPGRIRTNGNSDASNANIGFNMPLDYVLSLECSPPTCYSGGLFAVQQLRELKRYYQYGLNAGTALGCKITFKIRLQHPLFQQKLYLPANMQYQLVLEKCDSFPGNFLVKKAADTFGSTLTFGNPELHLEALTLTNVGTQSLNVALAETDYLRTYKIQRYLTLRYQSPITTLNPSFALPISFRPGAIIIHCVPTSNLTHATIPVAQHPCSQRSVSTAVAKSAISELYVEMGGVTFPDRTRKPWRDTTTPSKAAGGSAIDDYEDYVRLTKTFALDSYDGDTFLQGSHFTDGSAVMYFINMNKNGETFQRDRKDPTTVGGIATVHVTLASAPSEELTWFITTAANEQAFIRNQQVSRSY